MFQILGDDEQPVEQSESGFLLKTRVLKVGLMTKEQAVFNDGVVTIEIDDEAAGEFLVVRQVTHEGPEGKLSIDPRQWPAIRAAIDKMIAECRDN